MLARAGAYVRQHHLGLLALFVALGGTAYAGATLPRDSVDTRQLRDGAVTSVKVKDRSLVESDFKEGELPRGKRGAKGERGERGPRGKRGAKGERGRRGRRGAEGAAGATNVTVRTAPLTAAAGAAEATAACTGEERATGGGYSVDSGSATVQQSRPEPAGGTPTGWHVAVTATSPAQVTVHVVCAAP
jgi:hypothetical protein